MSDQLQMTVHEEQSGMLVSVKSKFLHMWFFMIAYMIADIHQFSDRCRALARSCHGVALNTKDSIMAFVAGNVRHIRNFGTGVIAHVVMFRDETVAKLMRGHELVPLAEHQESLGVFARCALSFEMRVMDIAGRLGNKEKRVVAFLDIAQDCQRLSRCSLDALKAAMENLQDSGRSWTRDQGRILAAAGHARMVAKLAAQGGYIEFGRSAYQLTQEYGKRINTVLEQIEFAILLSDIAPDYMPDDQQYWLTRALELATGIEAVHLRFDAVNTVVQKMVNVHIAPDEHMRLTDLLLRHVAGADDAEPEDVDNAFDDTFTVSDSDELTEASCAVTQSMT